MRTHQDHLDHADAVTHQQPEGVALARIGGWAGLVGPALFTLMVLLQNVLRREEFDPISEPVSGLGAGSQGWVQAASFAVFGILTLVFAAGLHRALAPSRLGWIGPGLLMITGIGLIWAAMHPLQRDESGVLFDPGMHALGGTLFFAVGTLAVIAIIPRLRQDPRWRSLVPYTITVALLLVLAMPTMVVLTIPRTRRCTPTWA
jgi:hypothetical membrane protein